MTFRTGRVLLGGLLAIAACGPALPSATSRSGSPDPVAPSAEPSVPPVAGDPLEAVIERDGVRLTLSLDGDRVAAGQPIRVVVTATNTGQGIVFWQGGGCDLLGNLALAGPEIAVEPVPDPPPGEDPAAVAGLIRWAALAGGSTGPTGFVPPDLPPDVAFGCDASLRINELGPGAVERIEAIWYGTTADGVPAPAGPYVASVAFPFLARQAAGPFVGDPIAGRRPIELEAPFEVVGLPWAGLSATQALDLALADPRVLAWIAADVPRAEVGGARIRFGDGRWRLEVDISGPDGDEEAVAAIDVDPFSGLVVPVLLPVG